MTIEQEVFKRKRFDKEQMLANGFVSEADCCILKTDFMDGDFSVELIVCDEGSVTGIVTDNMNDEEYMPLRIKGHNGAYVNSVRAAYKELLEDIAEKCCVDVMFASDQSNRIADDIVRLFDVQPDFPWDERRYKGYGVFRHKDSKKWFALIMNIDRRLLDAENNKPDANETGNDSEEPAVDVINLKVDEEKRDALHRCDGIYPAYHMNHAKWISVLLDETLSDKEVIDLVEESYQLTQGPKGVMDDDLIKKVLSIADSIPEGRVASYGRIAELAGRPKNARMVGRIMKMADRYGDHPCHRVVNHAGRTVPGWDEQRTMLENEGVEFKANGCVDMKKYQI